MKTKSSSLSDGEPIMRPSYPLWRNFIKTGAVFASISGLLLLQTACNSYEEYDEDYEEMVVVDTLSNALAPSKSVITIIREVKPQEFIIENEELVDDKNMSKAYIHYLNGTTDALSLDEIRARLSAQDQQASTDTSLHAQNESSYTSSMHTLGYVLMGGTMGYFLGKSMDLPPNPNVYMNAEEVYCNNKAYAHFQKYKTYQHNPYPCHPQTHSQSSSSGTYSGGHYHYNSYSVLRETRQPEYRTTTRYVYKGVSSGRTYASRPSRSSGGGSRYSG